MKILHINTYDQGGAAKAAIRLHLGLLDHGVDTKFMVRNTTRSVPECYVFEKLSADQSIFQRIISKFKKILVELRVVTRDYQTLKIEKILRDILGHRSPGLEMISLPLSTIDITKSKLYLEADIIHFHWVADFLNWQSFFKTNTKPVVWTLHDQNPMLGYEHYNERYCGMSDNGFPIIQVKNEKENILSENWLSFKKQILSSISNLTIVAPSQWLLNYSRTSVLLERFPHYHIPNGFPIDIFKPLDKKFSRSVLNLPLHKTILLFVADSVDNQRKGFAFLKAAFSHFNQMTDTCLCVIGDIENSIAFDNLICLGRIRNDELLAVAYSAADVFVIASLEDNLPNTMIESLLCGTPVIAFPTGGIQEVIENGVNGFLCENISVSSLRNTIETFLININTFNTQKIASSAKSNFSSNAQAKKYIELYKRIIS